MKKMKKIIVIALAATMLFGNMLTVNAASTTCLNCGSKTSVAETLNGFCYYSTSCHAPKFFYACAKCKCYWEKCTAGHMY